MAEWISVKKRLPTCPSKRPPGVEWLIFDGKRRKITRLHPVLWNKRQHLENQWGPFEIENSVTHWMPLPSPPATKQ